MSRIEYNNLLFRISQKLDETNARRHILFMCREILGARSDEDNHRDSISLFEELEGNGSLGPDNLGLVKEILVALEVWDLHDKIVNFESTRKEYTELIERVIGELDELIDLERLMSTVCRGKISDERRGDVHDVRSLFQVLEVIGCLGINNLGILKEICIEMEKDELMREVEDFQKRRIEDEKCGRRKAQTAAIMSSARAATQAMIGGVRVHCTFRTISGVLLVGCTGLILHKCSSLEDFVEAFSVAALPTATALRSISDGSVCFTVQAETSSALQELWQRYCNGVLQRNLQDFLVTDEIRELTDGEDVIVSVYIDEKEFKEAVAYLTKVEKEEIANDEVKDGRIQPQLPNTIEVKCQDKGPDGHKGEHPRCLDEERMAFVQNYLERADDARSVKTETSDSGMETRSALSELEMEERTEFPYDPCLKDVSEEIVWELTTRIECDQVSRDIFFKSFGLDHKKLYPLGMRVESIGELFPDTPINLLKDVCKALQMYDLVDLLEKAKPRSLRPALPLKEMAKLLNGSNRPTTVYRKAKVLIIDNEDNIARNTEIITDLFERVCPGSEICSVATACLITPNRYDLEAERYRIEKAIQYNDPSLLNWHSRLEKWKHSYVGPDIDQDTFIKPDQLTRRKLRFQEPTRQVRSLRREKEGLLEEKKNIEVMIEQEEEQSNSEKEKFKAKLSVVCEKWCQERGNQSVLLVLFQMNTGAMKIQEFVALDPITDIAIERLESFPTEAKFLLTPGRGIFLHGGETQRNISESLHVEYYGSDAVGIIFEVLSKRWQTLDLISIMREAKRARSAQFRITDNLSSIPRFREIEQ
ncbi:uncharacterized protein [Montipora foliosa]|uniref:uncharacterized protein n=1 Tax=Montipora foliosa TaxID=591990 RepID=UPI0035F20DBD